VIVREMERLQVIVDKTAGADEIEAMTLLADYVAREMPQPGSDAQGAGA
jgi:hypothetical protein